MMPDIPAPIQITLNGRLASMARSSIIDKGGSVILEIMMLNTVLRIMMLDGICDERSVKRDSENRKFIHNDWKYNSVTLEDQSGFIRRDSYSGDEHTPLGYLRHSLETGIRCDRG
jgi:hypothetical protein